MHANHPLLWLVVVAVIAAIAYGSGKFDDPPPSRTPSEQTGPTISGRAKIIDGDSLEVAGARIRLFGIDAPEAHQQCRDARAAELSMRARSDARARRTHRRTGDMHAGDARPV